MQFDAYIMVWKKVKNLKVAHYGLYLLFAAIVLYLLGVDQKLKFPVAGFCAALSAGIFLVSLMMLVSSNMQHLQTKEVLSIQEEGIVKNKSYYPYIIISNLEFYYHSFCFQSICGFYEDRHGKWLSGTGNYVSFIYNNETIRIDFSIGNESHARVFFAMMHHLKALDIPYKYSQRNFKAGYNSMAR
jgi:hypothetical protein